MLNQELIQQEYGFLGETIHINSCQVGLPPRSTQLAGQRYMADYAAAIASGGSLGLDDTRERVAALLARLVGGRPEEIAITKNTTEGIGILAMGYPLGPGDNVVVCDLENPANIFPWFYGAQQRGYEVRVVKTAGGRTPVSDFTALMDDRTRIVSISAVQAGTGYFANLAALAAACHARGAILAVDAIQALGRMVIDAPGMGIDFLSCGGYKGLLAGFGVGFLWCAGELSERIRPVTVGYQNAICDISPPAVVSGPDSMMIPANAGRFEAGTLNGYGIAMLESSVGLLLKLGLPEIEAHILSLESSLRSQLEASQLDIVSPEAVERRSGMVVAHYPAEHEPLVTQALEAEKIRLTHRPGYLRMAISFYNTQDQINTVAKALCSLKLDGKRNSII